MPNSGRVLDGGPVVRALRCARCHRALCPGSTILLAVLFALLGSVVGAVTDIVVTQRAELSHTKQELANLKASRAPPEVLECLP